MLIELCYVLTVVVGTQICITHTQINACKTSEIWTSSVHCLTVLLSYCSYTRCCCCCQSLSRVQLFVTPQTAACQASLSITNSWSCTNSCPLSRWCHPTISSSVIPVSSCLQSSPASGSFPVSQFCTSRGQNNGASALASVLPMNIQDWSPLGWTGWISLQSKGLL